ncbi:MAG: sigma-70 family RNA polymerase sigma factor [Polyangiales bacterium]
MLLSFPVPDLGRQHSQPRRRLQLDGQSPARGQPDPRSASRAGAGALAACRALRGQVRRAPRALRAPDADELANALGGLCTDDVFLACACARRPRRDRGLRGRGVMPHVPRAIVRIDRDETFVREVMEEVRIRLLVGDRRSRASPKASCRARPLTSWVQVTAIRTGYSFKRKRNPETPVADEDAFDLPIDDDPELARLRERVQEPFRAAFREALASLSPRERTLLRLYLLEEVSAETLGTRYDVHRATIARWITQARRQVHDETRRRLSKTLGLDARAFESLMNRVLSGLDVSLASFLERS